MQQGLRKEKEAHRLTLVKFTTLFLTQTLPISCWEATLNPKPPPPKKK